MNPVVTIPIIGYMHSPYCEKFGIPRQPNLVQVESYIEMIEPYNDILAFEGIDEFSHLWLLWQFHDNKHQANNTDAGHKFRAQVRPPRLGGNQKIGVFATRSMYRPSPIGLSVVRFLRVEKCAKSVRMYVIGSDLLNKTPILDIKPYIHYSDAVMDSVSGYAQDEPIRKRVLWSELAQSIKHKFIQENDTQPRIFDELEQVLSLDPRPAYHDDASRIYKMKFSTFDVSFNVDDEKINILKLETLN